MAIEKPSLTSQNRKQQGARKMSDETQHREDPSQEPLSLNVGATPASWSLSDLRQFYSDQEHSSSGNSDSGSSEDHQYAEDVRMTRSRRKY